MTCATQRRSWLPVARNALNVKFIDQRKSAKRRGIEFHLTFEAWWTIWQESGRWSERGRLAHQYCMARPGDRGAYEVGNVKIITVSQNCREKKLSPDGLERMRRANTGNKYSVGKIRSAETRAKISIALKGRSQNVGQANPMFGYVYTAERRRRLSQIQKLAWQKRRAKMEARP